MKRNLALYPGKQVRFRFYNSVDREFYGPVYSGKVMEVASNCRKPGTNGKGPFAKIWASVEYKIDQKQTLTAWVQQKEILVIE